MKKTIQKFAPLYVNFWMFVVILLTSAKSVFAAEESTSAEEPTADGIRINNAFKPINSPDAINQNYTSDTINSFLQFIAGSIIELTSGVAIFVLVIAGYMFVTAGGDQGRIDKAKEIIKYTIFGMLLIILSYVIVKTIISLIVDVDTF